MELTLMRLTRESFLIVMHSEGLCECKSNKLRLLYRHSLAELNDMVIAVDKYFSKETTHSRNARKQILGSNEPSTLTKKVCLLTFCCLLDRKKHSSIINFSCPSWCFSC